MGTWDMGLNFKSGILELDTNNFTWGTSIIKDWLYHPAVFIWTSDFDISVNVDVSFSTGESITNGNYGAILLRDVQMKSEKQLLIYAIFRLRNS
jgi:hypothetical protein